VFLRLDCLFGILEVCVEDLAIDVNVRVAGLNVRADVVSSDLLSSTDEVEADMYAGWINKNIYAGLSYMRVGQGKGWNLLCSD
jgi:hypothetical protein